MTSDSHAWAPVGALTSVFTPLDSYCATAVSRYQTFRCMPPNYSDYYWSRTSSNYIGYYSPAICPSGYTSACNKPDVTSVNYGPPLLLAETAIICCPSQYQCDSIYRSQCSSLLPSTVYSTGTYTHTTPATTEISTFTATPATQTYTYPATTSTETYTYKTTSSWAYAVQVRWQSSDLSVFETHPLSPGVLLAGASRTNSSTTSINTSTPTPSPTPTGGSGLSSGAKIGIGVGVSLGVLLLIITGLALCIFRRRQKRNRSEEGVSRNTEIALTRSPMSSIKPPTYVDTTYGVKPGFDLEGERLREEQARLQERRDRLRQLEQIDAEEERLRQQIIYNEAQKHHSLSIGTHEMRG